MWHHGFMPKRKSKKDVAQNALRVVEELIGEPLANKKLNKKSLISQVMSEMGARGGRIGGRNRASKLTPEKRREIASLAARTRWKKEPTGSA
jgi:hypothetical protein